MCASAQAPIPPGPTLAPMGFWYHLAHAARALFWLALIALLAAQVFGPRDNTQAKRDALLDQFQTERKSRVIALIHRQESRSILGDRKSVV